MTTPGGAAYSAGTIFLQVVPSFRNFQNDVRKAAKDAERAFADSLDKDKQIEQAVGRALDRGVDRSAPDAGKRMAALMAKDLQKRLDSTLKNLTPVMRITADTGVAKREVDLLLRKMLELRDKTLDVNLDVEGMKQAEAQMRLLTQQMEALDGRAVDIQANADIARAIAQLAALENRREKLDGSEINIDVDVRRGGLERIGAATQSAVTASQALRGFNAVVLGVAAALPLLPPLLGAAAGGFLAFGTAAGAGAAGLGVFALGLSGVSDAVKAMGKVEKDGAEQTRALARTQRAAAKGVREAQQGLTQARQNAAEGAEDAARRVAEARQDVARAEKAAARDIRNALQDVERAEDELADAQRNSARAQRDLREARKAAADDLADLESKVKRGALAERQALVDLFEAQVQYNAAQGDGATNLEREQAAIGLERARLALADQRRENEGLRKEQARLNKEGIEGTDRVVNARERVLEAQEKEEDASRGLREANERADDARARGAERIANAQERLADAQRGQARQAAESARMIASAQESLSDAQLNYRDAMLQTTATADDLADAMRNLSPAGQAFATFIFGLRDEFDRLRAAAAGGLLPGLQRGIESLLPFMPQIERFVTTFAEAMGRLSESTLKGLTTKPWRDYFAVVEKDGPGLIESYGNAFGSLATAFAQMFTAFAPLAVKMADGLERVTGAMVDYFASDEGQAALGRFMGYVERVGPLVIDFFAAFVRAMVNLGRALSPIGEVLLPILTGFLDFIADMNPTVLAAIVFGILALVIAFQVLAGVLGAVGSVAGIITSLTAVFGSFFGAITVGVVGTVAVVAAAAAILLVTFAFLYFKIDWFRAGVNAIFNAIWETIKFVVNLVIGILKVLATIFTAVFKAVIWTIKNIFFPVWELLLAAFLRFTPAGIIIKAAWEHVIKPAFDALSTALGKLPEAFRWAVDGITSIWNNLKDALREPLYFVVDTLLNNGLIKGFNKLADFFGTTQIDPIDTTGLKPKPTPKTILAPGRMGAIAGFANGGMIPGYSPHAAADNIPAMLTAGEYVLPVRAVKKLRAMFGDQFLEWLRAGGGYAKGGLVEFGRLLQSRQFRVAEHPAFGGVRGRHSKNSLHYSGNAIDVNYGPGGTSAIEQRAIDAIVGLASDYGLRTIWRTAGHFDHAHFDTGRGGSLLGKLGGGIKGALGWAGDKIGSAVEWVKDGPIAWLKSQVTSAYGPLRESAFGRMLIGGVESRVLGPALDKVRGVAGLAGDFLDDIPKPKLYDTGGWLPPGLTQVMNATGRPELILTPEQAERVMQGGASYQINVPMMPTNSTPAEVADAVLFAARRINRGGVYAGTR